MGADFDTPHGEGGQLGEGRRAGMGRAEHTGGTGPANEDAAAGVRSADDWRAVVARRTAAIRRSVAAMPTTSPPPPR